MKDSPEKYKTDKISDYIKIGAKDKFWYARCEQLFRELFPKHDIKTIARLFAATSMNTSLPANVTLFRKALYEMENNLPVSSGYMPNIRKNIALARNGEDLSGRKIRNFANAMSGDKNAIVVDVWITRAFGVCDEKFWKKRQRNYYRTPSKKEYDWIENYLKAEAKKRRIEPRQLCSMVWAGVRIATSGRRETNYHDRLRGYFINLFGII